MVYSNYMIGYVSGTVIASGEKTVIIETGGTGYKVFVAPNTLATLVVGTHVELWIHTAVREDALELFGFETPALQEVFELLITISGIGPKSALGILSVADLGSLVHAIKTENVAYLTQVSGIGKKTAEKIVLELKDKVEKLSVDHAYQEADHMRDVIDALVAMGYQERTIREVMKTIDNTHTDTSRFIREALQVLSK